MNQSLSIFLSRIVTSLLAMAFVLSGIGLFLVWAAGSVDREDIRRQSEIAGYALREIRTTLTHNQESSTFWDEAVEKTATSGNDEWIDGNLGRWMHTFFGVDEAYVLNAQNQPLYSFAENEIKAAPFYETRRLLFEPYIDKLRSKLATGELPAEGNHEQSVGVSDYIYVAGHPAVLSLKPIVSDSGRISQAISEIRVHVAVQYLEGEVIRKVGHDHVLEDLKWIPPSERNPSIATVPLTSDDGNTIIGFEWKPYEPGRRLLASLSPVLALVASALMVGTLVISSASYRRKLDRIKHNEHIRYIASHDPLTGLLNRFAYERAADDLVDALPLKQSPGSLAFLFMDLDRFKQINDILGHQFGDAVLVEFARRTARILPGDAPAYRVGGDEFAALVPNLTKRGVEDLCSRIVEVMAEPMDIDGRRTFVGVSIGVSMAPHHGTDRQELNRKADVALYHAKLAGRRRFSIFGNQMDDAIQNRADIEAQLREALGTKDGLSVVYQPKYSGDEIRVSGAEALVRWQHPERGAISPATFIPIAEDAGLIDDLGLWVLETACREAIDWPIDHLAVNVSPVQLRFGDFADKVFAILSRTGFPAERLELEMTETNFADSEETVVQNIAGLSTRGIAIAIDDFGTGSSTFERLRNINFDRIKIDRSFVKNIAQSEGDAEIVRAMISMAHAKGLKTTAEGVETPAQQDLLRSFGCDELQGFLLGKPMPSGQLSQILTASSAGVA